MEATQVYPSDRPLFYCSVIDEQLRKDIEKTISDFWESSALIPICQDSKVESLENGNAS